MAFLLLLDKTVVEPFLSNQPVREESPSRQHRCAVEPFLSNHPCPSFGKGGDASDSFASENGATTAIPPVSLVFSLPLDSPRPTEPHGAPASPPRPTEPHGAPASPPRPTEPHGAPASPPFPKEGQGWFVKDGHNRFCLYAIIWSTTYWIFILTTSLRKRMTVMPRPLR